jgi:Tol biopolymer transport system component
MGGISEGEGVSRWADYDFKFSWDPSGTTIYFERTVRGAKNIWRMRVDPQTMRATALERVTTGPGLDSELALSPDGNTIAFTGESQHIRAWLFPFDSVRGMVTGVGRAITSPGIEAWQQNLSRDGKVLAFGGKRVGKWELRRTTLSNSAETPVFPADAYERNFPLWSPDGTLLAYLHENPSNSEHQLMCCSVATGSEVALAPPSPSQQLMRSGACLLPKVRAVIWYHGKLLATRTLISISPIFLPTAGGLYLKQ